MKMGLQKILGKTGRMVILAVEEFSHESNI